MVLKGSTAQSLLQHAVQGSVSLVLAALASASLVSGAAAAPQVAPNAAAIQASAQGTVQVVAAGCGGTHRGSGFAISATQIVTNAHVVAGTEYVSVSTPQGRHATATVVLFDANRDVAILSVPGLGLHPLKSTSGFDSQVATIGYPGGGSETVTAGVVDRLAQIEVSDIYGNHMARHEVWVTHANLHPGNSGGPLVNSQGAVMGLIFAGSTTEAGVVYALTNNEIRPDLLAAQGRTQAVASGACI